MNSLSDKVVLITGGSSGIGRGTALRLAGLGARVVLAARNAGSLAEAAGLIEARGGQALTIPTDVTEAQQCSRAVEAAVERFGRLDATICSAGLSMRGYFEGSSIEALERVMRVNFFGTLYITHAALPHIKRNRGSLVAISSLTGKRGVPSYAMYGASKFAVQGLYEALRVELRRDGVHVGVVSPGFVDTPLRERVLRPDGETWQEPPAPPFRIWPVEKCVDYVVDLLVHRRREALLPWMSGIFLTLDSATGKRLGDRLLARNFPPEGDGRGVM